MDMDNGRVSNAVDMSQPVLDDESSNSNSSSKIITDPEDGKINSNGNSSENMYFGPALPPRLSSVKENRTDTKIPEKSEVSEDYKGNSSKSKVFGPTLPDHFKTVISENKNIEHTTSDSESEECNIIGPLPSEEGINKELEERAIQIKLNLLNKSDDPVTREEWMVELPEVKSVLQLVGPRKFRNKEMPDMSDRSSWTDTPEQKAKKPSGDDKIKSQTHTKVPQEKDLIQEKIVEKHKKHKRNKSLVDLHQEESRKKAKTSTASNERRPFSREIDLKSTKLSGTQTKDIINKAKLLDSRFSSGKSKFL